MTTEVAVLGWAGVLALVQLVLFAVPANLELGSAYLAGPRDDPRPLAGRSARLQRAFNNHIEGLVLFVVAVVVVSLSGASSPATGMAALIYLAARIVYVPLYAFGIRWWRSAVWGVAMAATLFILLKALI